MPRGFLEGRVTDMTDANDKRKDGVEDEHDQEEIDRLARRLDNSGIAEYVRLSLDTRRILWLNFLSGIARGLGFTVGTAIVLAIVYKILSGIISMKIPYLTEMLTEFVLLIKGIK